MDCLTVDPRDTYDAVSLQFKTLNSGDDLIKKSKRLMKDLCMFAEMVQSKMYELQPLATEEEAMALLVKFSGDPEKASKYIDEKGGHDFKPGVCEICLTRIEEIIDDASLSCKHRVCVGCAKDHLQHLISANKVMELRCPSIYCTSEYCEYHVMALCSPEIAEKYVRFRLIKSFQDDARARWCSNKQCDSMIIGYPSNRAIECSSCGERTCAKCKRRYHQGMCSWKLPNLKFKYLKARKNIKSCPRCKTDIEKSSGCNHITCGICGHEFCWICKANYTIDHFEGVFACSPTANRDPWGPNKPTRIVTKTLTGTVVILIGTVVILVASPFIVYSNSRRVLHRSKANEEDS